MKIGSAKPQRVSSDVFLQVEGRLTLNPKNPKLDPKRDVSNLKVEGLELEVLKILGLRRLETIA